MEYRKKIKDGFIVSVYEAQIEPVLTNKNIVDDFAKSTEMDDLKKNKVKRHSAALNRSSKIFEDKQVFYDCAKRLDMSMEEMGSMIALVPSKAQEKLNADEIKRRGTILSSIRQKENEIKQYDIDMQTLANALKAKRKSLFISKAIYMEVGAGEEDINKVNRDSLYAKLDSLKPYQRINNSDEKVIEVAKPENMTDEKWTEYKDSFG